MSVTNEQVLKALSEVLDPELHRSIVELDMVRSVNVSPRGKVRVEVDLTVEGCPMRSEIQSRVNEAVGRLEGVRDVQVILGVMSDAQRAELRAKLIGDGGSAPGADSAPGHAEGRKIPFAEAGSRTRCLLVASGKGGVGKSSVTVNLSVALAARGLSVAVVDADVWGFSIPRMLGIDRPPVVIDEMLVPPEAHGVRCISMGFFAQEDQPVIWRGPMLHKALEQFLTDVFWDEPDFLVIDLPPGTGDISISLSQFLPRSEVYIVTTPQLAAQRVAQRAAFMSRKVNLEVRGVIENMSWFTGNDGRRYELFGTGGGEELAQRLDVPLLGKIPLLPELREGCDSGNPLVATDPTSEAGQVFAEVAEKVAVELAPKRRYRRELRLVG